MSASALQDLWQLLPAARELGWGQTCRQACTQQRIHPTAACSLQRVVQALLLQVLSPCQLLLAICGMQCVKLASGFSGRTREHAC